MNTHVEQPTLISDFQSANPIPNSPWISASGPIAAIGSAGTADSVFDGESGGLATDEFLDSIYQLAEFGELSRATDAIFENLDGLLLAGNFSSCNEIFVRLDAARLPSALLRSFLTITAAAKDRLPARAAFYERARSEMIRLRGLDMADRLIGHMA